MTAGASKSATIDESFDCDPCHAYAVVGPCAIQMWRGEVRLEHVPVMERRWRALIERTGHLAILVVVLPSAPPPSPARREEIKRLYNALSPNIKAVGTVLEEQGIKGTTGAVVMTTIMLMSKISYPYKNGTSVKPIAMWLCEHVPKLEPDTLIAGVEVMRGRYEKVCLGEYKEPLVTKPRR